MIIKVFVFVSLILFSGVSDSDVISFCEDFKSGLGSSFDRQHVDFDLVFGGKVDDLGAGLAQYTFLDFSGSVIKIPYIGKIRVFIKKSLRPVVISNDKVIIDVRYYDSVFYEDVFSEYLGFFSEGEYRSEQGAYHEQLVHKGFYYTSQDLVCEDSGSDVLNMISYLQAKSLIADPGSTLIELKGYDAGFVRIKKERRFVSVFILERGNLLRLNMRASDPGIIDDWIGDVGRAE